MTLRMDHKLDSGAYADIFRPPDGLVYKLFASGQYPTNVRQRLTRPEDDSRRRNTFLSECAAYQRAGQHPYLRNHVPRFFGQFVIQDVTEGDQSVAHNYILECCYAMEYITGVATKLGGYRPEHIQRALSAFLEAGIRHLTDASVFFPDDPENFKFIDFAIEEFEAFW
jgi:hypothetical protein